MIYLEEKYPPPSTDSLHGDKVINVFSQQNFAISKSDTRDCHILGKTNPKNTIVRFTNCKFYNEALNKMKDLKKINKIVLRFTPNIDLYIGET